MSTFVRVVETGSFSAAARHLNVGQPAVSKTIAQLESRLRVSLLIRTTHGLTASEAGLRYYERAKAAIEEADEAELAARGAGAGLAGCLRVSAGTTFARLHIVPLLPRFLAEHPDLDIDVILDDRAIDLGAEGIDISVAHGEPGRLGGGRAQARDRKAFGAGDAGLSGAGRLAEDAGPKSPITRWWSTAQPPASGRSIATSAQTSVAVRGRVRLSAAEGLRAAVLADMGLAIASDWMFAPELANGAVRKVLEAWALPPLDLWAVFPTGRMATAKARRFAAFVEGVMTEAPPAYSAQAYSLSPPAVLRLPRS